MVEKIAVRYQDDLTVVGIEPGMSTMVIGVDMLCSESCSFLSTVNEPWEFTPIEILKQFYW